VTPPPLIPMENENTWRWLIPEGMIEAMRVRHSSVVSLRFRRWLGEGWTPEWETLWWRSKGRHGVDPSALFVAMVEMGPEEFMAREGIDVALPSPMMARFTLPDQRTWTRKLDAKPYKVVWQMSWHGGVGACACGLERAHWNGATLKIQQTTHANKWTTKGVVETKFYKCPEVEDGWDWLQTVLKDVKVALMEGAL